MPHKKKMYADVNLASGTYGITHFAYDYAPPDPEPTPNVSEGFEAVHLSEEVLGGLTEQEFVEQKRPIIEGSPATVTGWAFKIDDPGLSIDQDPYDDGSNIVTVTITGDPQLAGESYQVGTSRPISMSLLNGEGELDSQGDGSFKFKVIGAGPLRIWIEPRNHNLFMRADLDVNVQPAPFE